MRSDDIDHLAAAKRAQFVADAVASREEMMRNGMGYAAADVVANVKAQCQGKAAPKPEPKPWGKPMPLSPKSDADGI